jgi:hypothetical protein
MRLVRCESATALCPMLLRPQGRREPFLAEPGSRPVTYWLAAVAQQGETSAENSLFLPLQIAPPLLVH